MPYPSVYNVTYSYTGFQQSQGNNAFPGTQIDADLAGLQSSVSSLALFLKSAIRSDGSLNNGLVTYDSLAPALQVNGLTPALAWVTGTSYLLGNAATANGNLYRCLIPHTSGVFATDLAAGKWILVAVIPGATFTQLGTGAVTRPTQDKLTERVSVADFKVVIDVDDTNSIQRAITSLTGGGDVILPRKAYVTSAQINIAVSGIRIIGEGRGATTVSSSAAGHTFQIASGLSYVEFHDMQITRSSYPAISGQDGVHFTGLTERALVENVEVSRHWDGIRCGITSFSKLKTNLINNCYANGIHVTNADGAGGLQWTLIDNLCQQCNGWGVLYDVPTGSASVGEIINPATFANKLGGMAFKGTDATHTLNGIRIRGGFCGQDGGDEIFFDTYSGTTNVATGTFLELAGTSVCGVDLASPATNVGHGFNATANNAAVTATNLTVIQNSYAGISTNATRALIQGNNCRLNGAAGVGGEIAGISLNAGNATVVGNSSKAQSFGVSITNDNHVIVGNDLTENTVAPIVAAASLVASVVSQNLPVNAANTFSFAPTANGDSAYAITKFDRTVYTSAAFTAARTWTLPSANTVAPNTRIEVADFFGTLTSTNTLTVARTGADTIAGATSYVLSAAYSSTVFVSDGVSKWTPEAASYLPGQIRGTPTNDNAAAGNVGEYIESVVGSGAAVALTTGVPVNMTSKLFPAGDWEIDAVFDFAGNTTTTTSSFAGSISLTTATHDFTNGRGYGVAGNAAAFNQVPAGQPIGLPIQPVRFSFAAPTTVFAVASAVFGTSTNTVFGIIRGRRPR